MKKMFIACMMAAALIAFTGCGTEAPTGYDSSANTASNTGDPLVPTVGENSAFNDNITPMLSVEELMKVTSMSDLKGGTDKFTRPFYRSQIQYNEGFFLLENEAGEIDPVKLAFPAAQVLEVRSNDLSVLYHAGTDYTVDVEGNLVIPEGSAMTAMTQAEFFSEGADHWVYYNGEQYVPVTNNQNNLYAHQYTVTYIRTEEFGLDMSDVNHADDLTHLTAALEAGDDINMLILGDSIAAGAGVKSFPRWADQVRSGIAAATEGTVTLYNGAVPGIHSKEYVHLINGNSAGVAANIRESAVNTWNNTVLPNIASADFVIIAVGGNDSGGWCGDTGIPVSEYTQNVKDIIDYVRTQTPDASILLVSCMQTNPYIWTSKQNPDGTGYIADKKLAAADLGDYAAALSDIAADLDYENSVNLAFADVYSVEEELLKRKNIEDMLGDNRNHPSDYMTRIYTQVILDAVL